MLFLKCEGISVLVDFAKYLSLFLMYKPTFQALLSNAVFKNKLLLLDLI